MNANVPPGWGFAPQPKEDFDVARAQELETQRRMARAAAATRRNTPAVARRIARQRPNRRRCMHFTLWCRRTIATTGKWPTVAQVCNAFNVDAALGGAMLDDFEFAINQEWL